MEMTLAEIASFLGGQVVGEREVVIKNIRSLDDAEKGDLTFIANRKYLKKLEQTRASAILSSPDIKKIERKNLIVVDDPYTALGKLMKIYYPIDHGRLGISEEAYIEKDAVISPEATIFPHAFIGRGARIAKGVVIYPGVYVGNNVSIGEDSVLYAHVTVYHSCILGKRVTLHSGVVIGADGFGFAAPGKENVKIPQVGIVQIDDDVEIGANTTVDRATLGKTWIARNVKIDNLVQIAHNVVIGENSVITALVGISGSTKMGKGVLVGGQTGIVGHITIGDNVIIAADSKIHKNVASGSMIGGKPQMPYREWMKVEACRIRLPEMRAKIQELEKKIKELQIQISEEKVQ